MSTHYQHPRTERSAANAAGVLYGFENDRLDKCMDQINAREVKIRLEGASSLLGLVEEGSVMKQHVVAIVEALIPVTKDNNPKAVILACQCIEKLFNQHGEALRPHPTPLVTAMAETLGNNNVRARKAATAALASVLSKLGCNVVLERMSPAWKHKSSNAREEAITLVIDGLKNGTIVGGQCILNVLLPQLISCLEDSQAAVRKLSMDAIEECAMSVGVKVVRDSLKSHSVRSGQQKDLNSRLGRIDGNEVRNVDESKHQGGSRQVATRSPSSGESSDGSPKTSSGGGHSYSRSLSSRCGFSDRNSHIDADDSEEPVSLSSERELIREVEGIVQKLHGTDEDWNDRITTMKRLESILLGDSFVHDTSNDILKQLKDPLKAQLLDRRSSIVRQATKLLCTMGSHLGQRMEHLAGEMIPILFRVVVITVQIMAESADSCIRHLLSCCQSHRILMKICMVITKDRSSKLRAHCMEYLQLTLEEWNVNLIERSVDTVVEAIRHGLSDADAEARATARRCYIEFSHLWPDVSRSLLEQLDGTLQRTLLDSINNQGRLNSRQLKQRRDRPTSGRASKSSGEQDGVHGRQSKAKVSNSKIIDRKSYDEADTLTETAKRLTSTSKTGVGRVALERVSSNTLESDRIQSVSSGHAKTEVSHGTETSSISSVNAELSRPAPISVRKSQLNDILAMCSMSELSKAGVDGRWMLKVDMMNDLKSYILEKEEEIANIRPAEIEKVVDIISINISHPHVKVASAALDCLAELTPVCMPALNPYLDKLLPLLFPRLVDAKQVIRELSTEVLTAIGSNSSPALLLPGLLKSLDSVKMTKGRIGIVEFSAHYLVGDDDGGKPDDENSHVRIQKEWLQKVAPFCLDKSSELRSASIQCIIAVYHSNINALMSHVSRLSGDVRDSFMSLLAREIPEIEQMALSQEDAESAAGPHRKHIESDNTNTEHSHSDEEKEIVNTSQENGRSSQDLEKRREPFNVHPASLNLAGEDNKIATNDTALKTNTNGSRSLHQYQKTPINAVGEGVHNIKDLPLILTNAAINEKFRASAVEFIGRVAETDSLSAIWLQYFPQSLMVVLESVSDCLSGTGSEFIATTIDTLKQMVVSSPENFSEYMDLVVPRLFETISLDVTRRHNSEEVLESLFDLVEPNRCMQALLKIWPYSQDSIVKEDSIVLQNAIKMMNRTVVRLSDDSLKAYVPRILPGLFTAFSSSSADNRKAVVFILVDMYLICGNWLQSHLSPLSTSQHKLLTIYINRAVKMRDNNSNEGHNLPQYTVDKSVAA